LEEGEEDVFSADEVVVHGLSFFDGVGEEFINAFSDGEVSLSLSIRAGADGFFDFDSQVLEVEVHGFEYFDSDALIDSEQAEENMFGTDVVVVKSFCLLLSEEEYAFSAWCEIIYIEKVSVIWHDINLLEINGDNIATKVKNASAEVHQLRYGKQ
jgi:hypothetical protein